MGGVLLELSLAQCKRTNLIEKYEGYIKNISSETNYAQSETESEKTRLLSFWAYLLVSIILIHG